MLKKKKTKSLGKKAMKRTKGGVNLGQGMAMYRPRLSGGGEAVVVPSVLKNK